MIRKIGTPEDVREAVDYWAERAGDFDHASRRANFHSIGVQEAERLVRLFLSEFTSIKLCGSGALIDSFPHAWDCEFMTASAVSARRRAKPLQEIPGAATRRRLMDVAEKLFAERGLSGVSIREVALQASANVASVHYHFGSKEELISQVFERRVTPVLAQTNALLDEADTFADRPDYLERVIAAMVTPSIRGRSDKSDSVRILNRLREHLYMESREFAYKILSNKFYTDPALRVLQACQKALPDASPNEIAWKLHILFGALAVTTRTWGRIHPSLSASYQPDDADEALAYLVPLLAAMMRAKAPTYSKRPQGIGARGGTSQSARRER